MMTDKQREASDKALEKFIESLGGEFSYAWQDLPADQLWYKAWDLACKWHVQQASGAEPEQKKLIGWRTADYLHETDDRERAMNWLGSVEVLPIFEGDINTSLAQPPKAMPDYLDAFDEVPEAVNNGTWTPAAAYAFGWNNCRRAMLDHPGPSTSDDNREKCGNCGGLGRNMVRDECCGEMPFGQCCGDYQASEGPCALCEGTGLDFNPAADQPGPSTTACDDQERDE